mgnify:FL=1
MKKYECEPCGYIYDPAVGDPDAGIAPGTAFEDMAKQRLLWHDMNPEKVDNR